MEKSRQECEQGEEGMGKQEAKADRWLSLERGLFTSSNRGGLSTTRGPGFAARNEIPGWRTLTLSWAPFMSLSLSCDVNLLN